MIGGLTRVKGHVKLPANLCRYSVTNLTHWVVCLPHRTFPLQTNSTLGMTPHPAFYFQHIRHLPRNNVSKHSSIGECFGSVAYNFYLLIAWTIQIARRVWCGRNYRVFWPCVCSFWYNTRAKQTDVGYQVS